MSRNTRFGLRDVIAVSASSLLRAVRASKPSSCRMPATRSRISASSSTMRISAAMPLPVYVVLVFRRGRLRMAGGGEAHAHPGAPLARNFFDGVAQLDAAAMILDDASNNGEAKPGALLARRDIRLEQPPAGFPREADPVVDHIDDDVAALARGKDFDRALAEFG